MFVIWLFRRFIARRWIRNPLRPALLLSAVILATSLWLAVLRTSFSGVRSFEHSLGLSVSEYPLTISPSGGRIIASSLGPCLSGLANRCDFVAIRREGGLVSYQGGELPVRLVGLAGSVSEVGVPGSGMPQSGQVLISDDIAEDGGFVAGEPVRIRFNGYEIEAHVGPAASQSAPLARRTVVVPLELMTQGLSGGEVDTVLVRPYGQEDPAGIAAALTEWFRGCYIGATPLRVEQAQARIERSEQLLAAFRFNVMVMALMTLVVCMFLVSQATHASLITLLQELSVLRTLGFSGISCLGLVVAEAASLAAVGAIAGVTLGYPLTLAISSRLLGTAGEIYKLEATELGLLGHLYSEFAVVLTMVIVAVVGGALGGGRALRVAPAVGTRREYVQMRLIPHGMAKRLAATAVGLFSVALIALVSTNSLIVSYLFIAACVALAVGATPLLMILFRSWGGGGLIRRLACGGVRLSARGYVSAAMGASLALALVTALTLMVESFRSTLHSWMDVRLQGDLFIGSRVEGDGNEGRLSSRVIDQIERVAMAGKVVRYYEGRTIVRGQEAVVSATDLSSQLQRGVYTLLSGAPDAGNLVAGRTCMISEGAAKKLGFSVGDLISLEDRSLTVAAIVQEFGTEQPMLIVDQHLFAELYSNHEPQSLIVYLGDLQQGEGVRKEIESVVGDQVIVRDQRELKDLVMVLFDKTFQVTSSVRWIVFGIAALGLILSGLQLLWERRREVKTLLVLGAENRQIVAWSVLEAALGCLGPIILGVVVGVAMGWGLTAYINPLSFGWTLHFKASTEPVMIAGAFTVCVLVGIVLSTTFVLRRLVGKATLSDE